MNSTSCENLTESIKGLQKEKVHFDAVFQDSTGNAKSCLVLKKIIEASLDETWEMPELRFKYAEKLFGREFLGPELVAKVFDMKLDRETIPAIPFSTKELREAKKLGQFLVLRIKKERQGLPLTAHKLQLMQSDKNGNPDSLLDWATTRPYWYGNEYCYRNQTPRPGWALVSKERLPNSNKKNYLTQADTIVDFLETQDFGKEREWQEAIEEYHREKASIDKLIHSHDLEKNGEAGYRTARLMLNQLARQSMAELYYDVVMYYWGTGSRFLYDEKVWTNTVTSRKIPILVGNYAENSYEFVNTCRPDNMGYSIRFSRRR
jgi:hypothetical protein